MTKSKQFNDADAHKHFSAQCYNKAWDLMEKDDRTPEEDRQMIQLNQASIYHWSQREDCTPRNLSIGYWQASRIYSMLGQADNARHYGELSLEYSRDETPFYKGYAYEALARAEQIAGDQMKKQEYLSEAKKLADAITDPDEKKLIITDLKTII